MDLGHLVTVLTPRWDQDAAEHEVTTGGVRVLRHKAPVENRERNFWGWNGWATQMGQAATSEVANGYYHVIHAQDWRAFAATLRIPRKYASIRRVVTMRDVGLLCPIAVCLLSHDAIPKDCGRKKLAIECIPQFVNLYGGHMAYLPREIGFLLRRKVLKKLANVSHVVFPSQALGNIYPRLDTDWSIIPSPVNQVQPVSMATARLLREVLQLHDKPTVLFVGKPSPGKGWGLFVECARRFAGYGDHSAKFVHVGPQSQPIVGIHQVGPLPRAGVLAWMRASTVVMVPPLQIDTLPRTALEAQAQERYVVGTDRGGLPEIIAPGTGTAAEPRQIFSALADVIRYPWPWVIPDARTHVMAKFSQSRIAKMLAKVYVG